MKTTPKEKRGECSLEVKGERRKVKGLSFFYLLNFYLVPTDGPIVYQLGHDLLKVERRVRFPLGLQSGQYQTAGRSRRRSTPSFSSR